MKQNILVIYVKEHSGSIVEEKRGEEPTIGQIDGMNAQVDNSTIGEI